MALYRRKLEAADCLDTPEGAHVLHLAMLFVTGQHTAAGAASLSRELDARYSALIAKAPRAGDALDELQERRRRKVSSA